MAKVVTNSQTDLGILIRNLAYDQAARFTWQLRQSFFRDVFEELPLNRHFVLAMRRNTSHLRKLRDDR